MSVNSLQNGPHYSKRIACKTASSLDRASSVRCLDCSTLYCTALFYTVYFSNALFILYISSMHCFILYISPIHCIYCIFLQCTVYTVYFSNALFSIHHIKFGKGLIDHPQSVRRRGHLLTPTNFCFHDQVIASLPGVLGIK